MPLSADGLTRADPAVFFAPTRPPPLPAEQVSLLAVKALDDLAEFFAAVRCGPGNIAAVLGERERLQTALGAFKEELFAGPVSEAMLVMVRSEAHGPSQLLQLLANAFTLFQAYRNLDTYIARLGRDGPPGPGTTSGSASRRRPRRSRRRRRTFRRGPWGPWRRCTRRPRTCWWRSTWPK